MRYTKEILEPLVKESGSIAQVLKKLGKRLNGGIHAHVSKRIKELGIDTSHFTGQKSNLGQTPKTRLSALEYLAKSEKGEYVKSHLLKLKLIEDGIRKHQCELCLNTEWMGKSIPLELDHINGNHEDNVLENLRIVCPNCHAMQPTNSGKNKALKRINGYVANREQKTTVA